MKAKELKNKQLEIIKNFLVVVFLNIRSGKEFKVSLLAREMNVSYSNGITACLVKSGIIEYKSGNGDTIHSYKLLKEGDPAAEDIKAVWSYLKKHYKKHYPGVTPLKKPIRKLVGKNTFLQNELTKEIMERLPDKIIYDHLANKYGNAVAKTNTLSFDDVQWMRDTIIRLIDKFVRDHPAQTTYQLIRAQMPVLEKLDEKELFSELKRRGYTGELKKEIVISLADY